MGVEASKTTSRSRNKTTRSRKARPKVLKSINPRTGEVVGEVPTMDPAEVAEVVEQARKVAPEWASIPPEGRVRLLRRVRYRLNEMIDEIVDVVSQECGKPRFEALGHDVLPPAIVMMELERTAPRILRSKRVGWMSGAVAPKLLSGTKSRIDLRPYGVVGAITPWNYPLTNAFLAFMPALFAGNAVVIKPSEVTPRSGELLRKILDPLPSGVATVIQGGGAVGAAMIEAPVDKIAFIGSGFTGSKILETAAKHLTPAVMELGAKDAAIVLDDADLDIASSGVLWGSFFNAGQTCCSIERVFVDDSIADEFEEMLLEKLARVRHENDPGSEVGSLTFSRQLDIVSRQVADAVDKGAQLVTGGPEAGPLNSKGSLWYAPTILRNVSEDMDVVRDETFGPVIQIVRVRDDDEAVRRANEGANLTVSVWTKSSAHVDAVATRLRAGTVTMNLHGETPAMPWGPWGGVGESGFGRLSGPQGLLEFVYPVHVVKPLGLMRRVWWYPYNEESRATLDSSTRMFTAPTLGKKLEAAKIFGANVGKALSSKF
ncbi:MAG: aldehyde dehydrogenase family protein [Actinobacteria bacterium]|nr:aldehyde dehydrogenase family protein [Actinomycetota bacterium]